MSFAVPEKIVTHFHMHHGDRIADLGAGSGHFIRALSRAVGPQGKVFAVEIQKQLAEAITALARTHHLSNVESIWGDLESLGGTKINAESLDAVLFSNTLSLLEDRAMALREAARLLRKGGKLLVVDWTGTHRHTTFPEHQAKELAEHMGFVFERTFPAGTHHYGLSFRFS